MSFKLRTQLKDRQSIERSPREFVQPVQDAKTNSGAAAETARARNFFGVRTRKRKSPAFSSLKEKIGGLGRNRRERFLLCHARDRHKIIHSKRDAQAIEARPKIGSAGWDANRDLFHISVPTKYFCHVERSRDIS